MEVVKKTSKQNGWLNKIFVYVKENYKNMLLAFGSVFLVSLIGSLLVDVNSTWFESLIKPEFYPPAITFSIVWTILYIMWGLSFYLALKKNAGNKITMLYFINGALNVIWNAVFFRFHNAFLGVIVLVVLIISTYFLLKELYDKNFKTSFYLLVPYFFWLFFAFLLNYAIYFLN